MNSQREAFEKVFPVPEKVSWRDDICKYGGPYTTVARYQGLWEGWQAATEQGVGEAVAYLKFRSHRIAADDVIEGLEMCESGDVGDDGGPAFPVYTHPPKPTGGSVPECPYPCGWRELSSIITRKAAYFASATLGDEPWSDQAREYGIDLGVYARELCSLLATQQPPED